MSEREMVEVLLQAFDPGAFQSERAEILEAAECQRIRSFREAQVLTSNEGVVMTMADGSEFQVTVIKSR